jgi:hypothetical protein
MSGQPPEHAQTGQQLVGTTVRICPPGQEISGQLTAHELPLPALLVLPALEEPALLVPAWPGFPATAPVPTEPLAPVEPPAVVPSSIVTARPPQAAASSKLEPSRPQSNTWCVELRFFIWGKR